MDTIENRTFEEIRVGDSASLIRTLTPDDVKLLCALALLLARRPRPVPV